ncbi:hypothetical protein GCM10025785_06080 [Corynebacterium canis]
MVGPFGARSEAARPAPKMPTKTGAPDRNIHDANSEANLTIEPIPKA